MVTMVTFSHLVSIVNRSRPRSARHVPPGPSISHSAKLFYGLYNMKGIS